MRAPALLLTLMLAAPAAAQPVIYVRHGATGAADGSSWADAFPDLQPALLAATLPAQVWVAAGTYRPTSGTNREATFQLRSGVALYGGFDGTEVSRDERDWLANVTVLSGEIAEPGEVDDNSCHVVTAGGVDSTAVLDGFRWLQGSAGVRTPIAGTRSGAGCLP